MGRHRPFIVSFLPDIANKTIGQTVLGHYSIHDWSFDNTVISGAWVYTRRYLVSVAYRMPHCTVYRCDGAG